MPLGDFFWAISDEQTLAKRFPSEADGIGLVREWPNLEQLEQYERLIRELALRRRRSPEERGIVCPRVFISHRRKDVQQALRVAALARQEGFYFWLDILDPLLQTPGTSARLTTIIIEMALLNCTHVLAVMTQNTAGSKWVPYEYGRVKDPAPVTMQAASWIEAGLGQLPGYLYLGPMHRSETEIELWLRHEKKGWPGCDTRAIRHRAWIGGHRYPEPPPGILG